MALNAAAVDTRIKATANSTMYDMSRNASCGYFDAEDSKEARMAKRKAWNAQRTIDCRNGTYARNGGVIDVATDDTPRFVKDYHNFYKTPRASTPRTRAYTQDWNITSGLSFINMPGD